MKLPTMIRKGQWVRHADGIAIVAAVSVMGCEIHFVNAAGETIGTRVCEIGDVTQARLADIPAPRRPSPQVGARFGYV